MNNPEIKMKATITYQNEKDKIYLDGFFDIHTGTLSGQFSVTK